MTPVMDVNRFGTMPTTQYEKDLLRYLSENVTRMRTMRAWTQQELADKVKMHVSSIRQIEGNKLEERPRVGSLKKFAAAFECSIEDLFKPTDTLPSQRTAEKPSEKPQNGHLSDLLIEQAKKLGVAEDEIRKLRERIVELEAENKRLQK